jgi:hypothetical protein
LRRSKLEYLYIPSKGIILKKKWGGKNNGYN